MKCVAFRPQYFDAGRLTRKLIQSLKICSYTYALTAKTTRQTWLCAFVNHLLTLLARHTVGAMKQFMLFSKKKRPTSKSLTSLEAF